MTSMKLIPAQCACITTRENPDRNFTSADILLSGMDREKNIYRLLIAFDFSNMGPLAELEWAILYLYSDDSAFETARGKFTPYMLSSRWDPDTVAWDTQPARSSRLSGNTARVDCLGWYCWDISEMAKLWLSDPACNHGLILTSSEDKKNDLKQFYSLNHHPQYKCYRPYVEIKYTAKPSFILSSRKTINSSSEIETQDMLSFTQWENLAAYSMYTFFVQNEGPNPAHVFVQSSPDKCAVIDEPYMVNIEPGSTKAFVPQKYSYFYRLACKSLLPGKATKLKTWLQAQV